MQVGTVEQGQQADIPRNGFRVRPFASPFYRWPAKRERTGMHWVGGGMYDRIEPSPGGAWSSLSDSVGEYCGLVRPAALREISERPADTAPGQRASPSAHAILGSCFELRQYSAVRSRSRAPVRSPRTERMSMISRLLSARRSGPAMSGRYSTAVRILRANFPVSNMTIGPPSAIERGWKASTAVSSALAMMLRVCTLTARRGNDGYTSVNLAGRWIQDETGRGCAVGSESASGTGRCCDLGAETPRARRGVLALRGITGQRDLTNFLSEAGHSLGGRILRGDPSSTVTIRATRPSVV